MDWRRALRFVLNVKPLLVLLLVTFALGIVGNSIEAGIPWWRAIYPTIQLFVLEANFGSDPEVNWMLQTAGFLALFVTTLAATKAVGRALQALREQWEQSLPGDYVIICGLGQRGKRLADLVRQQGDSLVIMDKDKSNPFLQEYQDEGAIAITGDATEEQLLRRARVQQAKMLILVCGNEDVNASIALTARRLVQQRTGKPLTCIAHVSRLQLRNMLLREQISSFDLHLFDMYDIGARVLLSEFSPFGGVRKRELPLNLLVVGTGSLARSFVWQAARIWQVARSSAFEKLAITVASQDAANWTFGLLKEHPELEPLCSFKSLILDHAKPVFRQEEIADVSRAYVMLSEDRQAIDMILSLRDALRESKVPIIARVSRRTDLTDVLQNDTPWVTVVSLMERALTLDQLLGQPNEILARAIHQDYVSQQIRRGVKPESTSSLLPWDRLLEDFKASNRQQAAHIDVKLKAIGCRRVPLYMPDNDLVRFSPPEIELLAELEHQRFVAERERQGWTYAANKNAERKTSPFLGPWSGLDEEIKDLDRNTIHHLPILLASLGFKIKRL